MMDWCRQILDQTADHQLLSYEISDHQEALKRWPQLNRWQKLHQTISGAEPLPSMAALPSIDKVPTPERLEYYREQKETLARLQGHLDVFPNRPIDAETFQLKVRDWVDAKDQVTAEQSPWIESLQTSIQTNKKALWIDRLDQSTRFLDKVLAQQTLDFLKNYDVVLPEDVTFKQLREDVAIVMNYLQSGNDLTATFGKFLMPKPIRQRQYVFKTCSINGQLCNDWERLSILAKLVEVSFELSNLEELWHPYHSTETNTYRKIVEYREKTHQLQQQLSHYPILLECRQFLQSFFPVGKLEWADPEIGILLNRIGEVLHLREKIVAFEKNMQNSVVHLSALANDNTIAYSLAEALKNENISQYRDQYEQIVEWQKIDRQKVERDQLEASLQNHIPLTLAFLKANDSQTTEEDFTRAVYWSHAKGELEELFAGRVDHQFDRLAKIEAHEQAIAKDYLKAKALKTFTEAIASVDELNQHLTRWQQAVRQGAGSGKMAYKYRREAQRKLTEISKSIPCWVMPLYRIVETIDPRPGMFDVVIVDEASQLGPEAIFFNYIAKKVVVVGDDQQTAPENVGVDLLSVQNLIHTHLAGIPDQAYFDTKHSFFDHIKAVSGQPITLREHFRCMPEIIAFSNQICYHDLGIDLIPLKLFNHNRLVPLKKQYVENGNLEQDHNPAEAGAIVDTIRLLVQEEAYLDKTFGIISLQGKEQAAAIDQQLRQILPVKDYLNRKIRCGTAPDFQGDERDIIFLSLVTAPNHRRSALTKRAFRRRYNVAMSRAKQQVWLFHSVKKEDLDKRDLRRQLLDFFDKQEQRSRPAYVPAATHSQILPPPFDTPFEYSVYRELTHRGWEVIPKVKIGPYPIDLVVNLKNSKQLAIACDGDEVLTSHQVEERIAHQRVLERAGWQFFRINQAEFVYDAEGVMGDLSKL